MNYSNTNSSGTSSVAPGVGHFLLFAAPHGGGFVAFCALLKLIPTYIPGWGGSGFTLTGALMLMPFTKGAASLHAKPAKHKLHLSAQFSLTSETINPPF